MKRKNIPQDVWKKINKKGEDECWEWVGALNRKGYGEIRIDYKTHRAHRILYILLYGPIPKGLFVCHTCNNPSCCNPHHLFLGTHQDNMDQRKRENRGGSARGEKNSQSKLTNEDVKEIRNKYLTNMYTQKKLWEEYNVSRSCIQNIIYKKTWRHI